MKQVYNLFLDIFRQLNFSESWSTFCAVSLSLVSLFLIAVLAQIITRIILVRLAHQYFKKTKTLWDDFLIKHRVLGTLAHLPSAFIIYQAYNFSGQETLTAFLYGFVRIYSIIILTITAIRALNVISDMYQTTLYASIRPIKGYIQLIQILISFLTVIFIIAVLVNKSPLGLLAGLGAMAAVLLLIFRDTILGFVASIQLSFNQMVKIGDWIEMPGHNADGTVFEINLTTVKVQNWDKTITTIPTYALVSESFTNWSGMEESGGRRIKRSINIDMNTVRFCDKQLLEKLSHFYLLKDYITKKEQDIAVYNKKLQVKEGDIFNGRRQTNLGVFRHYLEAYLRENPNIHKEMTFLVRHLQPNEKGLPIEIYVFSKDQRWANYEGIQADIMDHILAILPEFGLKIFQNPSGNDLSRFLSKPVSQVS